MAVIRDRCYGMTSCGTGGIWSITSAKEVAGYFYGRTMIEDTSTSHIKFLEGKRSVYLPPKRGTNNQLMRAVPKVPLALGVGAEGGERHLTLSWLPAKPKVRCGVWVLWWCVIKY